MTTFPEIDKGLLCVSRLFLAIYNLSLLRFRCIIFGRVTSGMRIPYQFEYVAFHWRDKDDHMVKASRSTVPSSPFTAHYLLKLDIVITYYSY
jgi:hypothetical protein